MEATQIKASTSARSSTMTRSTNQSPSSTVYFDHCLVCNRICYLPEKVPTDESDRVTVVRSVFYSVYDIPASPQTVSSLKDEIPLCPGCLIKIGRLRELRDLLAKVQCDFNCLKEELAFEIVDIVAKCEKGVASSGMEYGWRDVHQDSIHQCLLKAEVDTLQQIIFDDWHERHPTDPSTMNYDSSTSAVIPKKLPTILQTKTKNTAKETSKGDPIFRTPFPPNPRKAPNYSNNTNHRQNPDIKKFLPRASFQNIPPVSFRPTQTQNMSKKLLNSNMFQNKKSIGSPPNLGRVGVAFGIGGKFASSAATISPRSTLQSHTKYDNNTSITQNSTPSPKTTVISITTSDENRKRSETNGHNSIKSSSSLVPKRKLSQDNEPNLHSISTNSIEILVGDEDNLPTKRVRRKSEQNSELEIVQSTSREESKKLEGQTRGDCEISVTKVESQFQGKGVSVNVSNNGVESPEGEVQDELLLDNDSNDDDTEEDIPDAFLLDEYGDIGLGDFLEGGGGQLEELDDDDNDAVSNAKEENEAESIKKGFNDDVENGDREKRSIVDPSYVESLIAHLQSGEGAAGNGRVEFLQNEEGLFVCMFCSKTFIHKYPYRDHLKTHTGEGPKCPICFKIFPKNHNLMLHLRTHTGEKPFTCDICRKGFADKSNLKVHYRVHTGERPYKCEYCDQAFVNSSRLVVHRRLHTGEKPTKSYPITNQSRSVQGELLDSEGDHAV